MPASASRTTRGTSIGISLLVLLPRRRQRFLGGSQRQYPPRSAPCLHVRLDAVGHELERLFKSADDQAAHSALLLLAVLWILGGGHFVVFIVLGMAMSLD